MAYNEVQQIVKGGERLYVRASNGLYSYNLNDATLQTYDKIRQLSDTYIEMIAWNPTVQKLLILYDNYNIDLLMSNDEVFTPPEVANAMLDMLPEELFRDPNTKFLDPACKSGVFLREIAKRLIDGLADQIPDLQERIDHIFHEQLYGIAITELTSLLSRRSLYCTKYPNSVYSVSRFDDQSGNIRYKRIQHRWKDGKCVFCGVCKRVCQEDAIKQICSTCMLKEEIPKPEITGNTFIAEDTCVNCSWCSEICPVDAISVTKPFDGKLELVENEAEDKICKGESCHACQDVCPCNAVTIIDGKSVTNLDFCNLCGACVTACPQDLRVLTRTGMKLENINSESWREILSTLIDGK
jgi:ferredoxin